MDSFQYASAAIPRKWNQVQLGSAQSIETSGGPYSGRFLRFTGNGMTAAASTSAGRNEKSLGNSATFSIAFAFRRSFASVDSGSYRLCDIYDAGTCQLRIGFSGGEKPGIYRGTTLLAEIDHSLVRNNWYHFRWKVTISDSCAANSNQLQVVGPNVNLTTTVATSTATRVTGNSYGSEVALVHDVLTGSAANVSGKQFDFSDVYFSNEEAVLLPNLRVHPLRPTANGTTMQWTPNTGTAWEALDDTTPDDDTTKISTSTDAHIALFTHAGLPTPAESVKAVQMAAWSKKDDAFDVALEPVYRIAGTNYFVSESPVGNAYAAIHAATDEDPAAVGAWTESVVNAMEIGVRVKQG